MTKNQAPYLKQKLQLYFDENFPQEIIDALQNEGYWRKKCKVYSAKSEGNENRDDIFHFQFCKQRNLVLVTLDKDFMDDTRYPFSGTAGIIRVVARGNEPEIILNNLRILLDFLCAFPIPRSFVYDTKFEVSQQACVIRGRDALTREIKSVTVKPGDTVDKVMEKFNYFEE